MRRAGYSAENAAAIEAICSTGGQLSPPVLGVAAFVMAFAGVEETRRLYRTAIAERYRFYSFGAAMLLL